MGGLFARGGPLGGPLGVGPTSPWSTKVIFAYSAFLQSIRGLNNRPAFELILGMGDAHGGWIVVKEELLVEVVEQLFPDRGG